MEKQSYPLYDNKIQFELERKIPYHLLCNIIIDKGEGTQLLVYLCTIAVYVHY